MTQTLTCADTGQPIGLVQQMARSGEGAVWRTDRADMLAKLYTDPTPQRQQKLEVMVAHPPREPNAHLGHRSFAWPTSLLLDNRGHHQGFLMPLIGNSVELIEVYNPRQRQKRLPSFNWLYLHMTARNIASIIWAIHEAGYVLGDIKPQNLLVNNRALPAIIDTDSFQVRHPITGTLFPCLVGTEGFTPPELLGQDLANVTQADVHDRFRLGMIIYLLLFGEHPFKGKWVGSGDSPEPNELIRRGLWPYGSDRLIEKGPLTIPLDVVHPRLKKAFLQCFNQGHHHPEQRPSAKEWMTILGEAIADLDSCHRKKSHYYSTTAGSCYWCQRKRKLGIDVFDLQPSTPSQSPTSLNSQGSPRPKPPSQAKKTSSHFPPSPLPKSQSRGSLAATAAVASGPVFQQTVTHARTLSEVLSNIVDTMLVNVGFQKSNKRLRAGVLQLFKNPQAILNGQWMKFTSIVGVGTGLFLVALGVSRAHITEEEMQLTLVGGCAFLGLIVVGGLWLHVLKKYDL